MAVIRFSLVLAGILLLTQGMAHGQVTFRSSVDSVGLEANDGSFSPALSANGTISVFSSLASNLVPGDTNGEEDVFVHNSINGATTRISVDSALLEANGRSHAPSISSDGRFTAFASTATNLVANDTNGFQDIFVHDFVTGATTRVSVDSLGVEANGDCFLSSISLDGQIVGFASMASNLVPGDTNGAQDAFVHDRSTGMTIRVSVDSMGNQGTGLSFAPAVSGNGQVVAFTSFAANLVSGDTNGFQDVFAHDLGTGTTTRVSVDSNGVQSNNTSVTRPSLSMSGRFVTFSSRATNLVPGDTNGAQDIFVHDIGSGETERVSVDSGGNQANADSATGFWISGDGRFVTFGSDATNLVPRDMNNAQDVFVHDRATGVTSRESLDSQAAAANDASFSPALSNSGDILVFASVATSLDASDTNGADDIYVRDLRDPAACRLGTVNANAGPVQDVLFLNGSAGDANRIVNIPTSTAITAQLLAPPSGPSNPRYILWIWAGFPAATLDLGGGAQLLGCTVNPTPIHPLATPQPILCIRGAQIPAFVCSGVASRPGPNRGPWSLTKGSGEANPGVFTVQAVVEDQGATSRTGFSVSNAIVLQIQ